MPGRLLSMDQSQDLKKDRSHAQEAQLPPKPDFAQSNHAPQVNGPAAMPVNGPLPNGAPAEDLHPATNGDSAGQQSVQAPPELDQSWRSSDSNKSMGKLIERLSQQCFADLDTTLTAMAETPVTQQNGQPNGVTPSTHDSDSTSLDKKRKFMQFAQGQRDRFIKTLVLTDWAQNAGDDMAKLVDLKVWQEKQATAQRQAIQFIGITKNDIRSAKMPNPNIEGALELLATGKTTRVPDLGYLPPKRFTAKQLLRTLQSMNVTLSTRLNLHEELPSHFNDFSIANGRATFRVAGEFEVDLSVADEDPATPFYFIDIRFLFAPSPTISNDALRSHLEALVNGELAAKGLLGCYSFLHNFVLTHKINVLRDQTERIQREKISDKWFNCVLADKRNRVFVIQYWTGLPGKKSWLEFGVTTGKDRNFKSSRPPTPRIVTRWFRRGEMAESENIDIDWNDIDVEKILSTVTAKHASRILASVRDRLRAVAGTSSKLDMQLALPTSASGDCSLKLALPGLSTPLLVRFESITGRLSLSPTTKRIAHEERALNNNANPDYVDALARLVCKAVQDRVDKATELAGWQALQYPLRQDVLKSAFGSNFWAYRAYTCSKNWGDQWKLFVTYSLSGESWWTGRLEDRPATTSNAPARIIKDVRRLPSTEIFTSSPTISRSLLLQIEKMAVAEVSFAVLSQQLTSMGIPFTTEKQSSLTFEEGSAVALSLPTFAIFFSGLTLLKDARGKNFIADFVKLTHHGYLLPPSEGEDSSSMSHEIRVTVETGKLKHLKEYLTTRSGDEDIAMNESNALALRMRTPFGKPYLDEIVSRLKGCDRLDRCLSAMHSFKFRCGSASLQKIAFTYKNAPELGAVITFSKREDGLPVKLKLEPENSNPHRRMRSMLEKALNRNYEECFTLLCEFFEKTHDVHRAFDHIESRISAKDTLTIYLRHPMRYQLVYRAPLPSFIFTVECVERSDAVRKVVMWRLSADGKKMADLERSDVGKAILELAKHKSQEWWGLEDGTLCARSATAGEIVIQIDELMQKFAGQNEILTSTSAEPANGTVKQDMKPQAQLQPPKHHNAQQKSLPQQRPPSTQQKQPQPNAKPPPAPVANMTGNSNMTGARNNQAKVKKEVIELD
ncbi:Mediator of RNA polymerase II transcription subunit 14 [Lecanosticta acicola]|uniref:Mediator of RNA polymerase II transcription subunit 14 n=1 Tax=Lecanosticta acicola TaxID=111012 RepID=A0AAI8Z9D6_9PEZI|nr:Mediator of RNA polymerase II transcription subunit 14 [Lecanosticta acicola]